MKTASGTLIALLNSGQNFFMTDLLTITAVDGTIYRWTNGDTDIKYGGNTFLCSQVIFKRSRTKIQRGLEVDTLDLQLTAPPSLLIGGIPFMAALANGYFDGSRVNLEKAVMSTWGDTTPGTVWLFGGRVSEVTAGRYNARVTVNSDLELLDAPFPVHTYQPGCMNTLFEPACGVVKATYTFSKTASAGSTTSQINFTDANPTGYYDLGTILFTSGQNTGAKRTIRAFTGGSPANAVLSLPLPYTPQVGDAFSIIPGCDKVYTGGCVKFGNQGRYRGLPEVPVPETVR